MTEDFSTIANDALSEIGSIQNRIDKLRDADEYLRDERKTTEKALGVRKSSNVSSEAVKVALESAKMSGTRILAEEIETALTETPEFDIALFSTGLYTASQSQDNFRVTRLGSGWSTLISVMVDMDVTAGSLDDYARGVEAFRELADRRDPNPDRASRYWRERIYGGELYYQTIRYRLRHAGGLAPYWQLLDLGNVPMASDWGGTAYPSNEPTNFTMNTAIRMQAAFRNEMRSERAYNDGIISDLVERLSSIDYYLQEIDNAVERLLDRDPVEEAVAEFEGRYGEDISVTKLRDVLNRIMSGEEVRTTSEGRIELTARGATTRPRPTLSSLVRALELE